MHFPFSTVSCLPLSSPATALVSPTNRLPLARISSFFSFFAVVCDLFVVLVISFIQLPLPSRPPLASHLSMLATLYPIWIWLILIKANSLTYRSFFFIHRFARQRNPSILSTGQLVWGPSTLHLSSICSTFVLHSSTSSSKQLCVCARAPRTCLRLAQTFLDLHKIIWLLKEWNLRKK